MLTITQTEIEKETQNLITTMAFAMQTAQTALKHTDRNLALEAALNSLTIALTLEAEYWHKHTITLVF